MQTTMSPSSFTVTQDKIQEYRKNGFVHIPGVISKEEAAEFREVALELSRKAADLKHGYKSNVFDQLVNVWRENADIRRLTLHPHVTRAASALAGIPLRLWHDQTLIKQPHNRTATEFHQDAPYWPHGNSPNSLSIWIALCDVPVERGCMTFIPGSFERTGTPQQDLVDAKSLFGICPEMGWLPRVTLPLRAGDCTFHHGYCAHMAGSNDTDDPRVVHAVIFMDATTTYSTAIRKSHIVTDPLGLREGQALDGEIFPLVK